MPTFRIGYAQFTPGFGERDSNLARIREMATEARADLLVFPELAVSGYEFPTRADLFAAAETFGDGPTSLAASDIARSLGCTMVIGYPERAGDRVFNACLLATPGGLLANYRKIHLFGRETARFDPGDAPPVVADTPVGRVGMMICFDWFFPETARILALAGARILAHPSNLVLDLCQRAMFARSVENRVFSITANRCGHEERDGGRLVFTGRSQVLDPRGVLRVAAPEHGDCLGVVEVDPAEADDKRVTEENDLFACRRVDLYGALIDSSTS
jgi:predicted amidohydrolase